MKRDDGQVSLRDLQRVFAKTWEWWPPQIISAISDLASLSLLPHDGSSAQPESDEEWQVWLDEHGSEIRPVLDRLASLYGAKMLVSTFVEEQVATGESRPKGTDEVQDATTCTSVLVHGGDGSSGEVPDGHSQSGASGTRQGQKSNRAFDSLRRYKISFALVHQVRSILATWIAGSGEDEQSARWNYPKLAARLLTRRSPYPAKKLELGRPVLLVMADVSGSCSSFSRESLAVAKAIAALGMPGSDIMVISHSNGFPHECEVNGRVVPLKSDQDWDLYQRLIAQHTITHVVAMGDSDAVELYTRLALLPEVQGVIWLSNYRCNYQDPKINIPLSVKSAQAQQKITYVTGCKGAAEFLNGLQVALRGG